MKLSSYVRVSSQEQAQDGHGLAAQESRVRSWCDALGHELVAVHRDEGVSGKVPPAKRPGLAAALASVRAGEADGVIVYKLDRLSRSVRDVLDLVDCAGRNGWALVSVCEALDTSTAAGRMIVTVLAALAQMEREQVGERTKEALAHLGRQGRRRSGRAPFGYQFVGPKKQETLAPHPDEQPLLAAIASMRADGHGPRHIARTLNEQGQRNPRTGDLWAQGTVADILRTMARRSA